MSPPTEQLIRDYLNRLSVAARGQLVPDDRRALVDRTRDFIERKASSGGPPTAVEVARLLSGLGDPAGLVSQERQRLARLRGEALEPAGRGRLARVLRGEPGRVRGASWHWPAQPGSRSDLQLTLIDGGGAAGRGAAAGTTTSRSAARAVDTEVAGQPVPPGHHDADDASATTAGPTAASPGGASLGGVSPAGVSPGSVNTVRPRWPALAAGVAARPDGQGATGHQETAGHQEIGQQDTVSPDVGPPDMGPTDMEQVANGQAVLSPDAVVAAPDPMPAVATRLSIWQLATSPAPRPSRALQRLSRALQRLGRAAAWARRNKLESLAIVLLGLGGVIFPPVWLLGVAVTLASRLWDYRDKWVGLALPVLLTVIGAAIGLAVGSRTSFGHGMHESWEFAVNVSRATALLSACYLGWRAARGPRPPAVPPWDKPHRVA